MTRTLARDTARKLLEIMPLVMRTVAAELRAAGGLPAPAHFPLLHVRSERPPTRLDSPSARRLQAGLCVLRNGVREPAGHRGTAPPGHPRPAVTLGNFGA